MRVHVWLTAALLFTIAPGCGSTGTNYGQPPDASTFNPGSNPGGDGYGSGSGSMSPADAGPPTCSDDLKRCASTFTYPFGGEQSVELRGDYRSDAWTTGDAMTHVGSAWTVTVQVPYNQPVQYKFLINGTTWVNDPANPNTVSDGNGNTNSLATPITCTSYTCDEPPPTPPGVFDWRDSVIYFVFVDRFFDGNPANNCNVSGTSVTGSANGNYEGGDWAGVAQKIDAGYFTNLGVNTLWITVPVKNADNVALQGTGGDNHFYSGYHGYWPYDLSTVEPCFGSLADLQHLVTDAHQHNLKVLFDFAMVQVEIDSPLYKNNPGWFWPNQNPNGPGDCICGQGCDWNSQGLRCWFAPYLPHWNYTVQAARDYSVGAAMNLIAETGIDGMRLDAIKQVDGSWLTELRADIQSQVVAKESPQQRFYLVGETYDFSNRDFIKSFIDPATKLDGQFDFPLRHDLVKATLMRSEGLDSLRAFMDSNDNYYGTDAVMSTFIGNHDMGRVIHMAEDTPRWDEYDNCSKCDAWTNQPTLPAYRRPFERLANAFAVLFTNRGAPLIYYGDEIGLPGAGDPDNRRFMQWTGWSSDQQWLHDRVAALLAIRAAHPALRRGARTTLSVTPDVWLYSMSTTGDLVYVAINRGDTDQTVSGLPTGSLKELLTATSVTGPSATIPARQTRIFVNP